MISIIWGGYTFSIQIQDLFNEEPILQRIETKNKVKFFFEEYGGSTKAGLRFSDYSDSNVTYNDNNTGANQNNRIYYKTVTYYEKSGKKIGVNIFYPDGKLHASLKKQSHGKVEYKYLRRSDGIKVFLNLPDSELTITKKYYKNGNIYYEEVYKKANKRKFDFKGYEKYWDKNGRLRSRVIHLKKGDRQFLISGKSYDENGEVNGEIKNRNGHYVRLMQNGRLFKIPVKNGDTKSPEFLGKS